MGHAFVFLLDSLLYLAKVVLCWSHILYYVALWVRSVPSETSVSPRVVPTQGVLELVELPAGSPFFLHLAAGAVTCVAASANVGCWRRGLWCLVSGRDHQPMVPFLASLATGPSFALLVPVFVSSRSTPPGGHASFL